MNSNKPKGILDETDQSKKQKVDLKVRWKADEDLKAIKIVERYIKELGDEGDGISMSHKAKSEMLKKPLLEWYRALRE